MKQHISGKEHDQYGRGPTGRRSINDLSPFAFRRTIRRMPPTDDSALLREYAENHSDDAFATLVTRHINLVYSVAFRHVGDPHHAEEITQAVFIILAKKALQLRNERALSSWLFQATRLTAHNFVRSQIRRQHREQEAYTQSVFNDSDSDVWQQMAPLLDGAVAALGQKDRRAIMLRFYEGRNLGEVGSALGINEEAARKRVNRALDRLRLFLVRRGVHSTAATIAATIAVNSVQAAPAALAKSVTSVAVAKCVVTSTSTLTLIKGVSKIMLWTKAKTAIVAGIAVILALSSLTVVSVDLARAHRSPAGLPGGLTVDSENLTMDFQGDGTVLFSTTLEVTNATSVNKSSFHLNRVHTVSRILDGSGRAMNYTTLGNEAYLITLPEPVPPDGSFSCTIEGSMSAVIRPDATGVCAVGYSPPGNPGNTHFVETWRLPAGAQLLDKDPSLEETTSAGRIELHLDPVARPVGSQAMLFQYRLPARSN
jgi:RNA polymerase sigma factor (sigma-70 family)